MLRGFKGVSIRLAHAPMFLTLVATLVFGASPADAHENLLKNGHFRVRQDALTQTIQHHSCAAQSAAANWTTWINADFPCVPVSGVELETDLVLGNLVEPGRPPVHIIHVRSQIVGPLAPGASGATDGLVQAFFPPDTGPTRALGSVWVYVVRGKVGMGVGNGGNTGALNVSSTLGKWEQLTGTNVNTVQPANEIIVYSVDPGGSEYYVDNAIVCPAPNDAALHECEDFVRVP